MHKASANPSCYCFIPTTDKGLRGPLETMIDSHVKLQRASRRGFFPLGLTGCNFSESGASIPLFLSSNLTVLKHPCALGAEQKPNAANAKLINRTPAAWASDRHTMPRRKYSVRVYCDNVLVSMGHALIGPLICFVNFVYRAIAFQKVLWLISESQLLGLPCAVRYGRKLVLPNKWIAFTQLPHSLQTLSDESQLIILLTE